MEWSELHDLIEDPHYTRKKIILNDGRVLSYSECGSRNGHPVLFCFGLMTSSLAVMFAHYHALEHNLRLIAVDYPGIGESTPLANRKIVDWGHDMSEFCSVILDNHQQQISILGHSLGGLHALSLLTELSLAPRIHRVVLLSPWVCFGHAQYHPTAINVARHFPRLVQDKWIPTLLTHVSTGSLFIANWSNPHHGQIQAAKMVTSYGKFQGQAGNEQMVRLALQEFQPSWLPQHTTTPIHIFHGTLDKLVLKSGCLELVRQLQLRNNYNVHFTSVQECDHNTLLARHSALRSVMELLSGIAIDEECEDEGVEWGAYDGDDVEEDDIFNGHEEGEWYDGIHQEYVYDDGAQEYVYDKYYDNTDNSFGNKDNNYVSGEEVAYHHDLVDHGEHHYDENKVDHNVQVRSYQHYKKAHLKGLKEPQVTSDTLAESNSPTSIDGRGSWF